MFCGTYNTFVRDPTMFQNEHLHIQIYSVLLFYTTTTFALMCHTYVNYRILKF